MTHFANAHLSRRGFVAMAAGVTAAWAMPWAMAGCSADSQAPDEQDANDGNAASPDDAGQDSPQAPRFDPASFTVEDALGDTYQQALAKAQEIAPDAMLFALRSSHAVTPGQTMAWDYMFASQKELRYYIAFTGNVVSVSELGKCTMKFAEWENVPPADEIKVDAATAYQSVCEAAADMPEPSELYVYLILYSEEADTAATEYSYSDEPLTWYFEFTLPEANEAASENGDEADSSESGDEGNSNLLPPETDAQTDASALQVYAVNARTGQTERIVG